jgi:hypothetical protein
MRGPSALSGEGGVLCLGEPYGDPPRAQSPLNALTVTRPLLRADDEPIKGVVVLRRVHSHLRRLLPVRPDRSHASLPSAHGYASDGASWKLGQPFARFAGWISTIRQVRYLRGMDLKLKRYAEIRRPNP